MKNPFIQAAVMMAALLAATRENAIRDFNNNYRKSPTRKAKFKADNLPKGYAGAKLARKALAGRIGIRH